MARDVVSVLRALLVGAFLFFPGSALADGGESPLLSLEEESAPLLEPVVNPTGDGCQRCVREEQEIPPGSGSFIWRWTCLTVTPSPLFNSSRQCTATTTGCQQSSWCTIA